MTQDTERQANPLSSVGIVYSPQPWHIPAEETRASQAEPPTAAVEPHNVETITIELLREAYSGLKKLPPLGFFDFDLFRTRVCDLSGREVMIDDLRNTLRSLCPKVVFFSDENGQEKPYISRNGDSETVVPHAFKANELKPKAAASTVAPPVEDIPLLAEVYNGCPDLPPLHFRDYSLFCERVGKKIGSAIDPEAQRQVLMRLCPKTTFWDSSLKGSYKSAIGIIEYAFRANELQNYKPGCGNTEESTPQERIATPEGFPPSEEAAVSSDEAPAEDSASNIDSLLAGISKDTLREVYFALPDLKEQWRDFAAFASALEERTGRAMPLDELRKSMKKRYSDVDFWTKFHYDCDGRQLYCPMAFRSQALGKKKSAMKALYEFASFPKKNKTDAATGLQQAIRQLAEKALPEKWHFGDGGGYYPILQNYLLLTFERLLAEDRLNAGNDTWKKKICVSDDGTYAVFNTGLVDNVYEPIYALFKQNTLRGQPWYFLAFVGSRDTNMQMLTRNFGTNLPASAHYYNDTSELVYDIKCSIGSYNWDHFFDHCERLPITFLIDNVGEKNFDFSQPHNAAFYNSLSKVIKADTRVFNRIKNRIEDAIDYAIKRVRWNFKTAIPIYYPGQEQISLLLPLSLVDEGQIDIALVLEATGRGDNKAYIAHTMLTLQMAYTNARLITRPDSDWLTAENIKATGSAIIDAED